MTIKFESKNNEVWDVSVVMAKLLTRLEAMEGLVLIDPLELQVNGVLPEGITIGFIKFEGMFDIVRDFDSKHKLDSIHACLVNMYHGSHALIILEKVSGPLPVRMLGQLFLNSQHG